jgi:lipopolysaccharide/colanic/teichoic acid biosynthesis glycosyltransferase
MIQPAPTTPPAAPATHETAPDAPTVWGLRPRELHDAYWRARGVQCIRRGTEPTLDPAAELLMLLEPDQLVLFDLHDIAERLTWHGAAVTRLRLIEHVELPYSERVLVAEDGRVRRIERHYAATGGSSRVIITRRRRLAPLWTTAENRRTGWDRLRRAVPWSRVDHIKCAGVTFRDDRRDDQVEFLERLVERWAAPDQAIDGIHEAESGIWHLTDQPPAGQTTRIGPFWLGAGTETRSDHCLVGPGWTADVDAAASATATLRPIGEVEMAEGPRRARDVAGTAYATIKRGVDIVGSLAALLVLTPVMLVISTMIWLEDGRPIFFGHERQGRGGRPFQCWKFRTMHRDAERIAQALDEYNICDGPQVFIQDDPRVNRVGRALRRMHLDELPQFWNVLVGEMSLVGPRPSPDQENRFCPAWREMRLSVRPGITGLWQVERTRLPGEDFQEWIKYDIEYVRRASLWLDVRILARTAWMVVIGRLDSAPE